MHGRRKSHMASTLPSVRSTSRGGYLPTAAMLTRRPAGERHADQAVRTVDDRDGGWYFFEDEPPDHDGDDGNELVQRRDGHQASQQRRRRAKSSRIQPQPFRGSKGLDPV